MREVLMPTRRAASGLAAVASTDLPVERAVEEQPERDDDDRRAGEDHQALRQDRRAGDADRRHRRAASGSCESACRRRTAAAPRIKIEAPIVMMISVTGDAPRAGAMASRYSSNAEDDRDEDGEQRGERQRHPAAAGNTVVIPPSITNSPWAKLTTSEAL